MAARADLVHAGFGEEVVEPIDQFVAREERSWQVWRRGRREGATPCPCAPRAEPSLLDHFQIETVGRGQRDERILLVAPRRGPLAALAEAGGRGGVWQLVLLLRFVRFSCPMLVWERRGELLLKDGGGAIGARWR